VNVTVAVTGLDQWSCGDVEPAHVLSAGRHLLEDVDPAAVAALAAAAAGSNVEIADADAEAKALIKASVKSDRSSLARAAKLVAGADDASREAWAAAEAQQLAEIERIKAEIANGVAV